MELGPSAVVPASALDLQQPEPLGGAAIETYRSAGLGARIRSGLDDHDGVELESGSRPRAGRRRLAAARSDWALRDEEFARIELEFGFEFADDHRASPRPTCR